MKNLFKCIEAINFTKMGALNQNSEIVSDNLSVFKKIKTKDTLKTASGHLLVNIE